MKLVWGISRWTNPSRAAARHIDDGTGLPLCGGRNRKVSSWEREEGEPTCQVCIRIQRNARAIVPQDEIWVVGMGGGLDITRLLR